MISLWLACYVGHLLLLTPDAWWGFPFIVTAVVSGFAEAFIYAVVGEWLMEKL